MKNRTRPPEGIRLIPLEWDASPSPGITRLFAAHREREDSSPTGKDASPFVILRLHPDAIVYLGALGDPSGELIYEWLEIRVQSADLAQKSSPSSYHLANRDLDERWRQEVESRLGASPPAFAFRHSREHPPALWFDAALRASISPQWRLCEDDEKLQSLGLPPYTSTCHRYLHRPDRDDSPLVPVTPSAPENEHTRTAETVFPNAVPFNPEGGLLLITKAASLGLRDASRLMAGQLLPLRHEQTVFLEHQGTTLDTGSDFLATSPELFLYPSATDPLRLAEALHLKLCWLSGCLRALREATRATQRPLLNVDPDSFSLRLHAANTTLPFLWMSDVMLARPGLFCSQTAPGLFLPNQTPPPSVYAHPNVRVALPGTGTVMIRQVRQEAGGSMEIEGTLVTPAEILPQPDECLLITLPLASERLEMRCQLVTEVPLGPGELRFRTQLPQVPRVARAALESADALPPLPATYVLYPALSSPCDLYSMGIVAAHLLLCGRSKSSLTQIVDELLAMARAVNASESDEAPVDLGEAIDALLQDPAHGRWKTILGPANLLDIDHGDAAWQVIGRGLWNDVLALILELLTGSGRFCYARTTAAAPATALHAIYDTPISDIMALVSRTRLIVLPGRESNQDLRQAILQALKECEPPSAS